MKQWWSKQNQPATTYSGLLSEGDIHLLPNPISQHQELHRRFHRWFWNPLERLFPVWYCNHWLAWLHREFERDRELAKTKEEYQALWLHERFESGKRHDQRELILTHRLLAKARNFHLSLQDLPVPSNQESHWKEGEFGHNYLSDRSYAALHRAIWQARKEYWDLWLKIIGAVTGLVGASIGLLALLKK